MKEMELTTKNKCTIPLQTYKDVLVRWKEAEKEAGFNHKLPVTAMLEAFGVTIDRLTNGGHTVSFIVEDDKKLLLAKIKYNF